MAFYFYILSGYSTERAARRAALSVWQREKDSKSLGSFLFRALSCRLMLESIDNPTLLRDHHFIACYRVLPEFTVVGVTVGVNKCYCGYLLVNSPVRLRWLLVLSLTP